MNIKVISRPRLSKFKKQNTNFISLNIYIYIKFETSSLLCPIVSFPVLSRISMVDFLCLQSCIHRKSISSVNVNLVDDLILIIQQK